MALFVRLLTPMGESIFEWHTLFFVWRGGERFMDDQKAVAYFSMEIGLEAEMPTS
jgi:hypothetical protein